MIGDGLALLRSGRAHRGRSLGVHAGSLQALLVALSASLFRRCGRELHIHPHTHRFLHIGPRIRCDRSFARLNGCAVYAYRGGGA